MQANKSLQTLDLACNSIRDAGAAALAEALKVVLGAQILIFRLKKRFLFAFMVIFNRCHTLCGPRHKLILLMLLRTPSTSFHVFRAWLAATNRVFSIDFLQVNKSLQTLDLSSNQISDPGAEALAEGLKVVFDAQILTFRLETCFLFAIIVILKLGLLYYIIIEILNRSAVFTTIAAYFINVVANLPRQASMCFEHG